MNVTFTEQERAFRDEVRRFVEDHVRTGAAPGASWWVEGTGRNGYGLRAVGGSPEHRRSAFATEPVLDTLGRAVPAKALTGHRHIVNRRGRGGHEVSRMSAASFAVAVDDVAQLAEHLVADGTAQTEAEAKTLAEKKKVGLELRD